MIYRIDFCGNEACSYTFIYDDTDKSVLYRPVKDGVDYPSLNIFYGEPNVSKLKLCGFSECYETLELHYCDYWIDDWYVKVYIYYYLDFFDSEISFKFYERSGKLAYLHLVDNCIVLPKSSYDWCGGEYTFTGIYMDIPVYMMSYLLNIRSVRDFSTFMDAFDGLFGLNIGKLVKGVDEVRWLEVEYWR